MGEDTSPATWWGNYVESQYDAANRPAPSSWLTQISDAVNAIGQTVVGVTKAIAGVKDATTGIKSPAAQDLTRGAEDIAAKIKNWLTPDLIPVKASVDQKTIVMVVLGALLVVFAFRVGR